MFESYCLLISRGRFVSVKNCIPSATTFRICRAFRLLMLLMLAAATGPSAWGQAPAVLWSTNVGASVFAVDAQTNVYAFKVGSVLDINGSGVLISSNLVCPAPGVVEAGRDAAGNLYFAGNFSQTQDFGGLSLTNTGANGNFFLAKYTGAGSLLWVADVGSPFINPNQFGDFQTGALGNLQVDPSGIAYIAFNTGINHGHAQAENNFTTVLRFDTNGVSTSAATLDGGAFSFAGASRIGAVTPTSGALIDYSSVTVAPSNKGIAATWDASGTKFLSSPFGAVPWTYSLPFPPLTLAAFPVGNAQGDLYVMAGNALVKQNSNGAEIFANFIGNWWTLAPDFGGGVHLVNNLGQIARYDSDGNPVWTLSFFSFPQAMVVDNKGNRFFSMSNGTVNRLAPDYFLPIITNVLQSQTVFAGSNVVFSVGASGSTPLRYYWLFQNQPLPGQTNAVLTLTNVTSTNAGLYSVIVSNYVGAATSAPPVMLRVKSVELFNGNQMLTGGTYPFASPPTLSIHSAFAGGLIFYTLNGSTPDFTSTPYAGPFVVSNSAIINAIGYSSDFFQSDNADTVTVTVPPQFTLSVSTAGGGNMNVNPPGNTVTNTSFLFPSNATVTVTANPAAGYSFLNWQGASASVNPTISVTLDGNKSLSAVFGTTIKTTVNGNGQVVLAPPGPLYPFGSVVRVEGVPQSGSFFGAWSGAAAGNGSTNPIYFMLTNPMPTISSIFGNTGSNQAALTVLVLGKGTVGVNPAGNVFATNQSVVLTAAPGSGESFVSWSGDASGTQNPLTVPMTQSKVIVAHFTGQAVSLNSAASGLSGSGFTFAVAGDPGAIYQILGSSNLVDWQPVGMLTNNSGTTQFTDPTATAGHKYYRAELSQ